MSYQSFLPYMQEAALRNFPENDFNQNHICRDCFDYCSNPNFSQKKHTICMQHCSAHVCAAPQHM